MRVHVFCKERLYNLPRWLVGQVCGKCWADPAGGPEKGAGRQVRELGDGARALAADPPMQPSDFSYLSDEGKPQRCMQQGMTTASLTVTRRSATPALLRSEGCSRAGATLCTARPRAWVDRMTDDRMKERWRGRLRQRGGERRTHTVSVRLSSAEVAQLDAARKEAGLQRGPYLRAAAFGYLQPTVPAINLEAWTALARAAGNLNQIARRSNAGDLVELSEVREQLRTLRVLLLAAKPASGESSR